MVELYRAQAGKVFIQAPSARLKKKKKRKEKEGK